MSEPTIAENEALKEEIVALRQRVNRVQEAIINPGKRPDYHKAQIDRLRSEWPTLYFAIGDLIRER